MKPDKGSFDAAIRAHDEAMAACGLDIWIGAEPTFTNRRSESPEWLTDALGETKQAYACHIIERLRDSYPGSIILRTLGRQYAGEERPRWSLGLYQRRDARLLADGLPAWARPRRRNGGYVSASWWKRSRRTRRPTPSCRRPRP